MQIFSLVLITSATLISSNPLSQYKPDTKTLQTCLASKGVPASFPSSPDFSQLAEPYNLRLVYTPTAIVLPTTNQQVADAVLCAGENNVKVQAKSGGRKYCDYRLENFHPATSLPADSRPLNLNLRWCC